MFDIIISVIMSKQRNIILDNDANLKLVIEIGKSFDNYIELKKKYEEIQGKKINDNLNKFKQYEDEKKILNEQLISINEKIKKKNNEQDLKNKEQNVENIDGFIKVELKQKNKPSFLQLFNNNEKQFLNITDIRKEKENNNIGTEGVTKELKNLTINQIKDKN